MKSTAIQNNLTRSKSKVLKKVQVTVIKPENVVLMEVLTNNFHTFCGFITLTITFFNTFDLDLVNLFCIAVDFILSTYFQALASITDATIIK